MLGVVGKEVKTYTCDNFPTPNASRVLLLICEGLNYNLGFDLAMLSDQTIYQLKDFRGAGLNSVKWLYEYYALHAIPAGHNSEKPKDTISEAPKPKQVALFGLEIKPFCIFTVDGVTYLFIEGFIVPFHKILRFSQFDDGMLKLDYILSESVSNPVENCLNCTIDMELIDGEEKDKFISLFKIFNV